MSWDLLLQTSLETSFPLVSPFCLLVGRDGPRGTAIHNSSIAPPSVVAPAHCAHSVPSVCTLLQRAVQRESQNVLNSQSRVRLASFIHEAGAFLTLPSTSVDCWPAVAPRFCPRDCPNDHLFFWVQEPQDSFPDSSVLLTFPQRLDS